MSQGFQKFTQIMLALVLLGGLSTPSVLVSETKSLSEQRWGLAPVIYEVNVRQYTKAGNFKALHAHLPRLQKMGVDVLWLMPVHPIGKERRKGKLGSPYSVVDYYGINPEYGDVNDFKNFVKAAQEHDMAVIMDWVPNHSAWDSPLIQKKAQWYTRSKTGEIIHPEGTDWTDVADFNYDSHELRRYMIDAMKYWVKEANVDGFRCDVAWGVPVDFWRQAIVELRALKPVYMLAEAQDAKLLKAGFDSVYGFTYYAYTEAVAQGKKSVAEFREFLDKQRQLLGSDWYRVMRYTSNHDLNSWEGPSGERFGKAHDALAVLSFLLPGTPLILGGQEDNLQRRLAFFEKDAMIWGTLKKQKFYAQLIQLYQEHPALQGTVDATSWQWLEHNRQDSVLSFVRQHGKDRLAVLVNLSPKTQELEFGKHQLQGLWPGLGGTRRSMQWLGQGEKIKMNPWEFQIYSQARPATEKSKKPEN